MTQMIYKFGPHSLKRAKRHVVAHKRRALHIMRGSDRRLWVCGASVAEQLELTGRAVSLPPFERYGRWYS